MAGRWSAEQFGASPGMDTIGADKGLGPAGASLTVGLVDGDGNTPGMGDHVPAAHAEENVDIGEAPAGLVERIGQVSRKFRDLRERAANWAGGRTPPQASGFTAPGGPVV